MSSDKRGRRSAARLKAVIFIYKNFFNPREDSGNLEDLIKDEFKDFITGYDKDYYARLMEEYEKLKSELPGILKKYVKDYDDDRITSIEKAILYIGMTEFYSIKEIPAAVIINEGIELAKIFGSRDSKKFINAILDSVNKDIKKNGRENDAVKTKD